MRGKCELLQRCTQHKLARVQHKRLILRDLHKTGQIVLLLLRVNMRVLRVVEHPKKAVHTYVNARRLDQSRVIRLNDQVAFINSSSNITV